MSSGKSVYDVFAARTWSRTIEENASTPCQRDPTNLLLPATAVVCAKRPHTLGKQSLESKDFGLANTLVTVGPYQMRSIPATCLRTTLPVTRPTEHVSVFFLYNIYYI